ncbi:MAG: lysoplasmalogenase [Spirochaetota bacterium]
MFELLLIGLFLLTFGVQAVGFFVEKQCVYYSTKPLLLPLLASYYLASSADPSAYILLALSFGWIGDIVLMLPGSRSSRKMLGAGILAFLTGHLWYICFFIERVADYRQYPWYGWLLVLATAVFAVNTYRILRGYARELAPLIFGYIAVLSAMMVFSFSGLGTVRPGIALLFCTGGLLFAVSDTANGFSRLARNWRLSNLLIMATYLGAQFALVQGALLLG